MLKNIIGEVNDFACHWSHVEGTFPGPFASLCHLLAIDIPGKFARKYNFEQEVGKYFKVPVKEEACSLDAKPTFCRIGCSYNIYPSVESNTGTFEKCAFVTLATKQLCSLSITRAILADWC